MPNPLENYQQKLRTLSDRLVAIQQPIRILDAIKWPAQWREEFFARGANTPPPADKAYYQSIPLGFDLNQTRAELKSLLSDIKKELGKKDPLGLILQDTTEQYLLVMDLLKDRGTTGFIDHSRALYGSAHDHLIGDRRSLKEVGEHLCDIFHLPAAKHISFAQPKLYDAEQSVGILQSKLDGYFTRHNVQVKLSDGIVSDAAAGGDSIKLNTRSKFSDRDLHVLEVHEGWVHVGTTLNGRAQPYATWLGVGSPRIAAHQEGLAVLLETLTFASFPARARRISDRVTAIHMAEEGADFLDVYRHFIAAGLSQNDSYAVAQRVFRGGRVNGGAVFTKDLSYVRGFVENLNFIHSAISAGRPELIPMLFLGKLNLNDIPVLYGAYLSGIIDPPQYVPPMFSDLNGLYVWFGFANGMHLIDMERVQGHFIDMFSTIPSVCPTIMSPTATQDVEL
ncbi:flavohemoglobin expression-modulating QEGLA motif protein [Pseudoalteromonas fenneropenaei]|uniref:Flavohemoglobin expression-modulating QEGLA motif protein n=1 Tax=Pseudoalteromonas fenneropenaei TaxID=1737459 RepID=A0ABV7CJQ7_9GAMM